MKPPMPIHEARQPAPAKRLPKLRLRRQSASSACASTRSGDPAVAKAPAVPRSALRPPRLSLVRRTSRGVVAAAEDDPATLPQAAACQTGSSSELRTPVRCARQHFKCSYMGYWSPLCATSRIADTRKLAKITLPGEARRSRAADLNPLARPTCKRCFTKSTGTLTELAAISPTTEASNTLPYRSLVVSYVQKKIAEAGTAPNAVTPTPR